MKTKKKKLSDSGIRLKPNKPNLFNQMIIISAKKKNI